MSLPTDNVIVTVKIIWAVSRRAGNWMRAYNQLAGIHLYLYLPGVGEPSADRLYVEDMMAEALDMIGAPRLTHNTVDER